MDFTTNLLLNLYSIAILIMIIISLYKNFGINYIQHKLFMGIIGVALFLLVLDNFTRLDGNTETICSILNTGGNFLAFLFNPVIPSLWFLYAHYQIFRDERKMSRIRNYLVALNLANVALVFASSFFGWFYYIDEFNIYHRGPLFMVPASITVILILAAFFMIFMNRDKIDSRYYPSMVFFAVPALICVIAQILIYGLSIMLNGLTLSILILYFSIQEHSINTDYLTGLYNRKMFEMQLRQKIKQSDTNYGFSAIMMDLVCFKLINDTYGHDVGDEALEATAKLIASCAEADDIVARYGGDEFCMTIRAVNENDLAIKVKKIKDCFTKYNASSGKPYKLELSMGYAVYERRRYSGMEDYIKQLDHLMYDDKRAMEAAYCSIQK